MHFPCRENISLVLLYMPGSQMNQSNCCFELSRPSQRCCLWEGGYSEDSKAHFPGVGGLLLPWLTHGCSVMQDQKPQWGLFQSFSCTVFSSNLLTTMNRSLPLCHQNTRYGPGNEPQIAWKYLNKCCPSFGTSGWKHWYRSGERQSSHILTADPYTLQQIKLDMHSYKSSLAVEELDPELLRNII